MTTKHRLVISCILVTFVLTGCASTKVQDNIGTSMEATAETYAKNRNSMGTVLLDVKWARQWGCASYENAQLISFSFDRLPSAKRPDDTAADLVIGTTSRLAVNPRFVSLALLIPPGEYALSNFKIKVASSVLNVGYWVASRSNLLLDGKPYAGSFRVAAGETVYIGNFALDCFQHPSLWRYYSEDKEAFKSQLADYQTNYPFLDLIDVKYRLFDTKVIGRSHELQ